MEARDGFIVKTVPCSLIIDILSLKIKAFFAARPASDTTK